MLFLYVQLCGEGRGQNARARMAERGGEQAGQGQVLLRVLHSSHLQQVASKSANRYFATSGQKKISGLTVWSANGYQWLSDQRTQKRFRFCKLLSIQWYSNKIGRLLCHHTRIFAVNNENKIRIQNLNVFSRFFLLYTCIFRKGDLLCSSIFPSGEPVLVQVGHPSKYLSHMILYGYA